LFTTPFVARAQQAGKVYQIGYLSAGVRAGGPSFQLFELVLHERGWVTYLGRLADLSLKQRLPTICHHWTYAKAGGLMNYSVNAADTVRRVAGYVDRILRGANPGELPVEQPTKFEFVINLKTAKALGVTFPPSLLLQADQAIE
jgi:ABC transporter substrate binding protein